jgi:cobaltochelatase CobN
MWDEVKAVYIDDRHELGLDEFLEKGHNAHVKTNMLAIMLVAAQKGFWEIDKETLEKLSSDFADLIIKNGLPGSGHTHPDHPIYDWIASHLTDEQLKDLKAILDSARMVEETPDSMITTIAEIEYDETNENKTEDKPSELAEIKKKMGEYQWLVWSCIAGLIFAGIQRGRQKPWEKN